MWEITAEFSIYFCMDEANYYRLDRGCIPNPPKRRQLRLKLLYREHTRKIDAFLVEDCFPGDKVEAVLRNVFSPSTATRTSLRLVLDPVIFPKLNSRT